MTLHWSLIHPLHWLTVMTGWSHCAYTTPVFLCVEFWAGFTLGLYIPQVGADQCRTTLTPPMYSVGSPVSSPECSPVNSPEYSVSSPECSPVSSPEYSVSSPKCSHVSSPECSPVSSLECSPVSSDCFS